MFICLWVLKLVKNHKRSFSSRKNEIYNSGPVPPELSYSDEDNEHAHGYYMNYISIRFVCLHVYFWTKIFILLLLNSHEWFTDVGCQIILIYIHINQVVIVHVSYTGACSRKNQMLRQGLGPRIWSPTVLEHQSLAINWKIEIDCTLKTFSQLFQALLLPPWKQIVEDNESSDWLFGQSSSRYILPFDAVVLNRQLKKAVLRKEENYGFVRNLDFHQLHWDTGRPAVT